MKTLLRAALLGSAVDLGGSTFVFGTAATLLIAVLASNGATHEQLYLAQYQSTPYLTAMVLMGLFFNGLGGFVAARIANKRHILTGAAAAIPCLFLGLFGLLNPLPNNYPLWTILVGWFFCMPSGALGGYIAARMA